MFFFKKGMLWKATDNSSEVKSMEMNNMLNTIKT